MSAQSDDYLAYMSSLSWEMKRMGALGRSGGRCERCDGAATEVHHLTYKHLGDERDEELQALCHSCHITADRERERRTAQHRYRARFDGWMTARHGAEWEFRIEPDERDYEQFEEFIERGEP